MGYEQGLVFKYKYNGKTVKKKNRPKRHPICLWLSCVNMFDFLYMHVWYAISQLHCNERCRLCEIVFIYISELKEQCYVLCGECVTAVIHTVTQHVWVSQEPADFWRAQQCVSLRESFQESLLPSTNVSETVSFSFCHAMPLFHTKSCDIKVVWHP